MRIFIATFCAFFLAGCLGGSGFGKDIQISFPEQEISIQARVADSDKSRARGLMFERELCEMCGMLFVFEDEQPRTFWMKNTFIPLDILFLDSEGTIVDLIQNMRPEYQTDEIMIYTSKQPAKYVLEVNAKFVHLHDVKKGDSLVFDVK